MSTLWRRFLRLWKEPRIRLPSPGLRPQDLRPGDRLQIASRLWRIEKRSGAGPDTLVELTAADGPADRARLRIVAGCWALAGEPGGSPAVTLDPAVVIHFPIP